MSLKIGKPRSAFDFYLVTSNISILKMSRVFTALSIILLKMNQLHISLKISSLLSARKGTMGASVWNFLKESGFFKERKLQWN